MKKDIYRVKNTLKRTFAIAIALVLAFGVMGFKPEQFKVKADVTFYVNNETDLYAAVNTVAPAEKIIIYLTDDIILSDTMIIPVGQEVEITSSGVNPFAITGVDTKATFFVEMGASLTIGFDPTDANDVGIIVTHNPGETGTGIITYGAFILNNGVICGNNTAADDVTILAGYGGGVSVQKNLSDPLPSSFVMNGGSITNNSAERIGGGVHIYNGNFILNGGFIDNNYAGLYGGGIGNEYGMLTIYGGDIFENTADRYGGGIFLAGGLFCIDDIYGVNIYYNSADVGGGIFIDHHYTGMEAFVITGGNITENTATYLGGGIYCTHSIYLEDTIITYNTANSGGGVYFDINYNGNATTAHLVNTYLAYNVASTATGGEGQGGGIFTKVNLLLSGNTLEYNTARDGGAVYLAQSFFYQQPGGDLNAIIDGGLINANQASNNGGGIYNCGVTTLRGTRVTNNRANNGGGIYVDSEDFYNTSMTISDNAMIDTNTATVNGGGVYTRSFSKLFVEGIASSGAYVTFANNVAGSSCDRDPANNAVYASNIIDMENPTSRWSTPFTQGYNNYDINQAYEEPTYVLTYNVNGGTPAITPDDLHFGETISDAPGFSTVITKEGFVFDGWFLNEGLTTPVSTGVMPDAALTIYAKWRPVTGDNPETGDVANIALAIGTMAISAGAVYLTGKKRKH